MFFFIFYFILFEVDEFIYFLIVFYIRIFRFLLGFFRFDGAVLNAEECDREVIIIGDGLV